MYYNASDLLASGYRARLNQAFATTKKPHSSISFLYDIVPPGVSVAVAFAVFTTFGFLMLWYRAGAHLNNIFVSRQLHSYSLKYSFSFSLPLFNSITKLCVVFKSIIS